MSVDDSKTLSLTETLFPGQSSSLPQNKVLNMTFNCATGQLDVHVKISEGIEIIPQVLSFSDLLLSLRVKVTPKATFQALILSANTQLFSKPTFVAVRYDFGTQKFSIPQFLTFSVKQLTDGISNLKTALDSLPQTVSEMENSKVTGFNFNPQTKELALNTVVPEITLIPNILKLTSVTFKLEVVIGSSPSVKSLTFSGTWKIGTASLTTTIQYNEPQQLLHVTAKTQSGTTLNIEALTKKIAGVTHSLPSKLTSFTLTKVVGNIYTNGKYFVAMEGSVSGGQLYLLFHKGSDGVKVGIAASITNFHLSDIVKSATGIDITSVPYFGSLVVPSMAISITSGTIMSPTLPHLFASGSPLLSYSDTLPAGVTAQFKLQVANTKGAVGNVAQGMISIKIPSSSDLTIRSLSSQLPGFSDAINALPSQLTAILEAKVVSFSFNTTSKALSVSGTLSHFTVYSGFLSISNVEISYSGTISEKVTTTSLDFKGIWNIGDYSIQTIVLYDGVSKQLTITSQSEGGKQFSIENVLEDVAGTDVLLPSAISSLTFTGLSGKIAKGTALVILNGKINTKGKVSIVFEKTSTESQVAVVADITSFKLAELVQSATGTDISSVPLIGSIVVPELKFAAATNNITSPLLTELAIKGSAIEEFKNGIFKGISGRFVIQIGDINNIAVEFVHNRLSFKIPDTSALSLNTLLSSMPQTQTKDTLNTLPSQLSSIFSAKIASFSYDPDSKELEFYGSIADKVNIIPPFASLSNVKISLTVVLGPTRFIKQLDFSGDWILQTLPIRTTVSYDSDEKRIDIVGELDKANGEVKIKDLITSLSGQSLPLPSVLSSVTLTKLSGNKIGDATLVTLSGATGSVPMYIIYQKSSTGSAIALAADGRKFRFASLVSSATGIDISNFPFFGTLVIPQIGFTIASNHINNPLLSDIYPSTSYLAKFGDDISKGVSASFTMNFGEVRGLIAYFTNNELELVVPDTAILSLSSIFKLIPGVQDVVNQLPSTLRDIASTRIHRIFYRPTARELQLSGSLESLTIIPSLLSLKNIEFEFSGVIGSKSTVNFARFKGTWVINSLSLKTEISYENALLVTGYPADEKSINVKDFIKGLTGTELNIPSALNALMFTQVIGKVDNGVTSLVFVGEIGSKANVSIVYEKSKDGEVVVFVADVQKFKLAELVKAGSGVDISSIPFFGTFIIPALSFVISSKQFSTANLPDLNVPGIPKELTFESIPEGVKGQFSADIGSAAGVIADYSDIGSAVGVNADYSDNVLTIVVPPAVSVSLQGLLSIIPQIKTAIVALPSTVRNLLSAKVTKLVFKPATKDIFVSLSLQTLTLVPNMISLKDIQISLDVRFETGQLLSQELAVGQAVSPYVTPFDFESPATFKSREMAEVQVSISMNTFQMKGTWFIHGIGITTDVTYDKSAKELNFEGVPSSSNNISITDLIKSLSSANLKVPSVISSLKLTKVVAQLDDYGTIVILTATAGSADIFLVFEKSKSGTNTAIAADIEEFKLADLIKTATSVDVSDVPFVGPFIISTLAFSVSTNVIYSSLFSASFDSDSPLQEYGSAIPKGLTAYFKAEINGHVGIEVTYAEKILDFKVPDKAGLSLQGLLSEIPSISTAIKSTPSPISDLLACNLKAIRFDTSSKTLSVAANFAEINIIPNIMLVKNLDVSIVAVLGPSDRGLQSLDFSADWILRNINIRIKVSYNRTIGEVLFAAIPKEGLNIQDLISGLTGISLPIPSAINTVKLTKIVGRKSADVFTFIFSGTVAGKANVHLVYQKFGTTSNVAIAVGIKSFKLADLVKSAANIDITGIPFFGTFSVPSMAFAISKNELSTPLLSQVLAENSPLLKYGDKVPSGFTAEFQLPLGKEKEVVGSYVNKVLSFTVPDNVDVSLGDLVSQIPGVDIKSLALPPVLGDILSIRLNSFVFDVPSKEMSITIFIDEIDILENLLSISKTSLKLIAKLSAPRMLTAEATGVVSLGNNDRAVDMRKNPTTKKYEATIQSENIPILGIAEQIGAALLPDDLNDILGKVFNFNILNAKIVYPFGAVPQQILISGTPELWGLKTIHMTAVAVKYGGKMRLIQKYTFGQFNIADFIKKLIGISLHKLFILNQEVDISFIVSPTSIKDGFLSSSEFNDGSVSKGSVSEFNDGGVNKGVSFKLPIGFPPNCDSDRFCAVAKKLLGNRRLSLEATIVSSKSFTMTASIGNLKLGGGVVLEQAGLQIQAGTSPSVGFVGSIKLKNPDITLGAAIRATVGGVKLEGSMSGCWYNAFGSEYLSICNLFLAITIVPTPVPISGLELGGRIELGKKSCGRVLTAEGYIGVNVINPNENYFYANVGPLTFQKFFDAFCISVPLPRPLAESGFPDGFQASFSLLGKELPHAEISIPPGYRYKGTINILGFRAYADINILLPKRISIKAGLPPMKIANLFKMYASRHDRSRGPYLIVDISTSKVHIEASGFVELLGMSAEVKLLITSSKYEFYINGRFLNLFNVRLRIQASYENFANANFQVEGWFKNDLFDKIAGIVRGGLKKSANEVNGHISRAQNKIRAKKRAFYAADRSLRKTQRKVNDAKRSFYYAVAKMERARRKVRNVCRIRSCGSREYITIAHSYPSFPGSSPLNIVNDFNSHSHVSHSIILTRGMDSVGMW